MTLDDLMKAVPDALKPLVTQYGPGVLKMAQADLQQWLNYVFVGRYLDAYTLYLKAASADDILAEWDKEHATWVADNTANAAQMAMSKEIALAVCKVLLALVLAAAGL